MDRWKCPQPDAIVCIRVFLYVILDRLDEVPSCPMMLGTNGMLEERVAFVVRAHMRSGKFSEIPRRSVAQAFKDFLVPFFRFVSLSVL